MRQSLFETKLSAMRSKFRRAAEWLDSIPREKWTQCYDGGKRYGHMTTNLAECMNFVLKEARALPITALVKATFSKINVLFVNKGTQIINMLRAGHVYSQEAYELMQENRRIV